MDISEREVFELRKLEESLWQTETRFDRVYLERVFAPDFFEFGRSGRAYSRTDSMNRPPYEIVAKLPLKDFQVRALDGQTVLVTYISEVKYEELERANRSSIWTKTPRGWQIRFHQGTPIAAV